MKKIQKTPQEWQATLSPEAYRVTQLKGTEMPFSGQYVHCNEQGEYCCICCDTPLFSSAHKFDAHCGWPSFDAPINPQNISEVPDLSHGMQRIEIVCSHCGAHLGHVFDDGPTDTGLRYCVNSVSLTLKK